MAKSPQLDEALRRFAEFGNVDESQGTIEGQRRNYERMADAFSVEEGTHFDRINAGGVAAEMLSREDSDPDRVTVYVHGGGYVIGSVRTHRVLMSQLAAASGGKVLGLEYRLAPEHPFPAPVEDSLAAYQWLLGQGYDPGKISFAGDSAGGGLVLAALVAIRYLGEPMAGAGVCISPWIDMEGLGDSIISNAEVDPVVQKEGLEYMAGLYLGDLDRRAPLAAPLYADLRELPPILIQVGGDETLLDDSTRLADKLKESNVPFELEVWEDMFHVWHAFAPILPEGQQAIDQAGEFIRKNTG
jgi:acetyl esterase/lipase